MHVDRVGKHRVPARALMIASGFSGLGLQIVWTQQGALALGHEAASMLAVVTAFFGGIAAGAFALGGRIARAARPARWYAGCEAVIGGWAVVLAFAFAPLSTLWVSLLPLTPAPFVQWAWIFAGTFILLLPATAAMGATLPAMERILDDERERGASIPALYSANTAGAVLGALGAAFVLIPMIGLRATTLVCGAVNIGCAVVAARSGEVSAGRASAVESPPRFDAALGVLAVTGLLGIGYEVLVVRALSQIAENTVYTFAILLAMYLVGTTLGAAWYARRARDAGRTRDGLFAALALACLFGALALAEAATFKAWMAPGSFAAALMVEALLAAGAFLPATVCMGALFSLLATAATRAGVPFARSLGVNTLGAALAPLVFAALMTVGADLRWVVLGVVAAYLVMVSARAWRRPLQMGVSLALLAAMWVLPSPAHVDVPEGGRVVRRIEGPLATVSIVADARDVATLHIDNKQQEGSSATVFADGRQGVLPLLLHPHPGRALFLGLGTGVTARAASAEARVDVVELLPEVIEAAADFEPALPATTPLRMIAADARRFVRASADRYDVIVADNFHPARSGSGTLYTVEHFRAVRERLADDGLFCQWLPLHQLDLDTLRSIVRSYLEVNPNAAAVLATNGLDTPTIGLVARRDGAALDESLLAAHLARPSSAALAARFGFADELAVLGSFIAGPDALVRFANRAPLNTDDRPVVAYSAPRVTYAPDSSPRDRLFALLADVDVAPEQIVARADPAFGASLRAYWKARDAYLLAGRDVRPVADVHAMIAQVRNPLLEVLRLSPDFRPAYDPLLSMAAALGREDPSAARELLQQLADVSPARPEAPRELLALGGGR
ncbi:MAG TPA: hypothetical protein VMF52_16335 [Steroidobacteraceae bacterium]|nr:hypothetical protein [Steroidobacteraceae bacterium]